MIDIFGNDGQAEYEALSDEAFATAEAEQPEEERQAEETPQNEAEEIENTEEAESSPEPEEGQTSEEGGAEEAPAEEEGQAEDGTDELARLRKNYEELRSWDTRVAMENAELKKQLEALKNNATPAAASPAPVANPSTEDDAETVKNRVRLLVNDPGAFIAPMLDEKLKPFLEKEEQREAAAREERAKQEFNDTYKECSSCWGQLSTQEGQKEMVAEMVKLSQMRTGKTDAWQTEPARYIFDACRSLWGLPKVNNPEVVEAAKKAERDAVMAEMNSRGSKSGLAINNTGNKTQNDKKEPEVDPIIAEMMGAKTMGLFD